MYTSLVPKSLGAGKTASTLASTELLPRLPPTSGDGGSGRIDRAAVTLPLSSCRYRRAVRFPYAVFESKTANQDLKILLVRSAHQSGGPDSLNRISASISGASAGIRLPRGGATW
jgi:hypothetical protein